MLGSFVLNLRCLHIVTRVPFTLRCLHPSCTWDIPTIVRSASFIAMQILGAARNHLLHIDVLNSIHHLHVVPNLYLIK